VVRSLAGLPTILSTPSVDKQQNLVLLRRKLADLIGVKKNPAPGRGSSGDAAATVRRERREQRRARQRRRHFPAMLIFKPERSSRSAATTCRRTRIPGLRDALRQLVPFPRRRLDQLRRRLRRAAPRQGHREPLAVSARAARIALLGVASRLQRRRGVALAARRGAT
jgi:hypothetical protein